MTRSIRNRTHSHILLHHVATILVLSALVTPAVRAQQSPTIPDAPAFIYLGASPEAISRPTSARNFAISLADGIDSLGRVRRGLAIDFAPWILLPIRMTNRRYGTKRGYFALGNLQMSLGAVQAAGDSTSTDIALGLRTSLWDGTDPLADSAVGTTMDSAVVNCVAAATDSQSNSISESMLGQCIDTALTRPTRKWLDAGHWNDFGLSIAGAFGARLRGSDINRFVGRGGALWATIAIPIGDSFGQIVGQARGDWMRATGPGSDTTALSSGVKLVFGGARTNGFGEIVGSWKSKGVDRTTGRWSVGVEYRASANLWLSVGIGSTYSNAVIGSRPLLTTNLRWNASRGPRFGPR